MLLEDLSEKSIYIKSPLNHKQQLFYSTVNEMNEQILSTHEEQLITEADDEIKENYELEEEEKIDDDSPFLK